MTCSVNDTHPLESYAARRDWTATEGNQVVLSDESRFNLSSDDNRVCAWKPHRERFNPTFALQRHTAPTAGVMVWGAIAYNTRSPLVLICGTMIAQQYVHEILQPHVLPLMQRLLGAIFQQDNARLHTARMSQDCLHTATTLTWPARSPHLSPIEHIWDSLGWRVGHPTSFNGGSVNLDFISMDDNARPQRAHLVNEFLESEDICRMDWLVRSPDLNPIAAIPKLKARLSK
ncbi:transposable element Tcb2 transposase [Trichonephila clavipes]|nr:transposable element Tcb2 transposase [Trichonephila clavipes]